MPNAGYGLLIHKVSRSHTTTHRSRYDSSGRVISSLMRSVPDSTQLSQETNIHTPDGIWTHNHSRRAAADLLLRQGGHWDRRETHLILPDFDACQATGQVNAAAFTSQISPAICIFMQDCGEHAFWQNERYTVYESCFELQHSSFSINSTATSCWL
jgi:hypothetical protein